jgi:peroxiredoxin
MTLHRRALFGAAAAALLACPAASEPLPLAELPGKVEAPEFGLADMHGEVHRLAQYRGRSVLVAFWAVWCPPCRRELAALAELRTKLRGTGFEFLAINLGDSRERIAAFLERHPAPGLPVLLDTENVTAARWHVRGLPVAYVVDTRGILRLGALGERDWRASVIEGQLRALI